MQRNTVGLFGTCGGSIWRDRFIAIFDEMNIPYFNPQVANWTPELADVEAWHLANDQVILFPVTAETTALASLAETGYSLVNALDLNANRFVIVYIASDVCDAVKQSNPQGAADSLRARKLVKAHLAKVVSPRVIVVDGLEAMLDAAIRVYGALALLDSVGANGPDWRSSLPPAFWHSLVTNKAVPDSESVEDVRDSLPVSA